MSNDRDKQVREQGPGGASSSGGREGWTWAGLAVVAAAAAVMSFASLRDLAVRCEVHEGLAWLLPVAIDAAAVVATRVWLSGRAAGRARRYARVLALSALGLSVAGNAAEHGMAAYAVRAPWWVVVAVSAVPPVVLGAVAHLAALVASDRRSVEVDAGVVEGGPGVAAPAGLGVVEPSGAATGVAADPVVILSPRVDAGEQLPTGSGPDEVELAGAEPIGPAPAVEDPAAVPVAVELAGLTQREALAVAWAAMGIEEPATSDVMPARDWLAARGVDVDRSRAYEVRRNVARERARARAAEQVEAGEIEPGRTLTAVSA